MAITIRDLKVFVTAPEKNQNLVVVKLETSEPGLYGIGCASFAFRSAAVCGTLEKHLKPLIVGRDVMPVRDLWQLMMVNGYWRNGPVLNNAVSGVDMALWDIRGKIMDQPLYNLLGGKCRDYVTPYRHCNAKSKEEIFDIVDEMLAQGFKYIRSNYTSYDGPSDSNDYLCLRNDCKIYDSRAYVNNAADLHESLRARYGNKIELMTDVHERIDPPDVIYLAKRLEPVNMYFIEDPVSPENWEWLRNWRSCCATPIALGELFVSPQDYMPLVKDRLIDFFRIHPSMVGGITGAMKAAAVCEPFGIRTAFHGPLDASPVSMAASVHMDLALPNFGIQEFYEITERMYEIFPGAPYVKDGKLLLANDEPGLGVGFDEKAAAKYPPYEGRTGWTEMRFPDGSLHTP